MGNIISNIKNRMQVSAQNRERDYVLKNIVANIGEIVEEDDKIICYVKQDMLTSEYRSVIDVLFINGLFNDDEHNIEYLTRLDLNKPIYYIFDGINFDWWFRFSSKGDCNVIFKNCTFRKGIFIKDSNNVTFENNTYYDYYNSSCLRYSDFFTCKNTRKLTFINEKFVNMSMGMVPNNFGIDINTDILKNILV